MGSKKYTWYIYEFSNGWCPKKIRVKIKFKFNPFIRLSFDFLYPRSEDTFWALKTSYNKKIFIIDTFQNVQNNPHIGPLIKIRGSKMILAEQALRWAQRKSYLMQFWLRNLTFKIVFFQFFPKSRKVAILFCRFHHENTIPRKNGVHHEKANGKCNKTVDSDFWFSNYQKK